MGKGTPGLRFKTIALKFLKDLFKAPDVKDSALLNDFRWSFRIPYKSRIALMRG